MNRVFGKPLSILVINQSWFAGELRSLGHRVITAGWAHESFDICFSRFDSIDKVLDQLPADFALDRLVYFDDSYFPSLSGLESLNIPTVFFSVDTHHHHQWHCYFGAVFDLMLVAQKDYLQRVSRFGARAAWFPLWSPWVMKPEAERPVDVSFRGNLDPQLHPERAEFFTELSRRVSVNAEKGKYQDVYPRAKIVVNQSVGGDLNFRVFEATAAGALLVTPRIENGLASLFVDGVDIVTYQPGNAVDAADKIQRYLEDDAARERIAQSGYQKTSEFHTAQARAQQLTALLSELQVTKRPISHYAQAVTYITAACSELRVGSDINRAAAERFLRHAVYLLTASFRFETPSDEQFEFNCLSCKFFLEQVGLEEYAQAFGQLLYESWPESSLFAVSYLEDLRRWCPEEAGNAGFEGLSDEQANDLLKMLSRVREEILAGVLPEG